MRWKRRRNQRHGRAMRWVILAVAHNGQTRARRITLPLAGVPHDALVCPKLRIPFFPWKKDPNKQSRSIDVLKMPTVSSSKKAVALREPQKKALKEIAAMAPAKKAAPKKNKK